MRPPSQRRRPSAAKRRKRICAPISSRCCRSWNMPIARESAAQFLSVPPPPSASRLPRLSMKVVRRSLAASMGWRRRSWRTRSRRCVEITGASLYASAWARYNGPYEFARATRPKLSMVARMMIAALTREEIIVDRPAERRQWTYAPDIGAGFGRACRRGQVGSRLVQLVRRCAPLKPGRGRSDRGIADWRCPAYRRGGSA